MAKKIRVGVIGAGAIALRCHLPGYAKEKDCEIMAIADPSQERGQQRRQEFGIQRYYPDWKKMLANESLDVVSVCTPNADHAAQAIAALEAGCHVLCEKPLCTTMQEAYQIQKAHKKSGKLFMTGFTHRFYSGNPAAKKALDRGDIGEPFMLHTKLAHSGPYPDWALSDWFFTPKRAAGGAMLDLGIHMIDIAHFFFGPIKTVSATVGTLIKNIKVDDNAAMALEFENHRIGTLEAGWCSVAGFSGTELVGTEGAIEVNYRGEATIVQMKTSKSGKRSLRRRVLDNNPLSGGWEAEMAQFVKYIRRGEEPIESLQAGIDALAVALAAYRSAEEGHTISIKQIKKG